MFLIRYIFLCLWRGGRLGDTASGSIRGVVQCPHLKKLRQAIYKLLSDVQTRHYGSVVATPWSLVSAIWLYWVAAPLEGSGAVHGTWTVSVKSCSPRPHEDSSGWGEKAISISAFETYLYRCYLLFGNWQRRFIEFFESESKWLILV